MKGHKSETLCGVSMICVFALGVFVSGISAIVPAVRPTVVQTWNDFRVPPNGYWSTQFYVNVSEVKTLGFHQNLRLSTEMRSRFYLISPNGTIVASRDVPPPLVMPRESGDYEFVVDNRNAPLAGVEMDRFTITANVKQNEIIRPYLAVGQTLEVLSVLIFALVAVLFTLKNLRRKHSCPASTSSR